MLAALLALPGAAAAQAGAPLESQASGLFINAAGQILTAAHAVTGCASLYALKDGQVRRATVVARDDARDLALLDTGFKPYLSATFAATPEGSGGRPVFTEAYGELQRMPARASTVFNGMTARTAAVPRPSCCCSRRSSRAPAAVPCWAGQGWCSAWWSSAWRWTAGCRARWH